MKSKILLPPLAIAIAVALTATLLQLSFNNALGAGEEASISAGPSPITEGAAATFTVTLDSNAPVGGLTISVTVTDSGSYLDGPAPMTVVIAENSMTGTLTVLTEDDSLDELDGTITAEITAPDGAGYTVAAAPANEAEVAIADDDDPLVASITAAAPPTITEGATATFTVALDRAAPTGLEIGFNVRSGGGFISAGLPSTVSIVEGATTGTLTIPTDDDSMDEPDGSIEIRINAGTGYTVDMAANLASVNIEDNDDPAPVASITADPSQITEGTDATFTVALTRMAPAGGLTISAGVSQSGSYIVGLAPRTFMIPIAEGAMTGTLTVETDDDGMIEETGSITAELNMGAGYTVDMASNQASVTVLDDDAPVASITAGTSPIAEGTEATFTVTLSSMAPTGGVTINVAVTESGSFFEGAPPMTVVIASGAMTVTLAVRTEDDSMDEPDGSITAEITAPNMGTDYAVGTMNTATVTVNDGDPPAASISAGPSPITEGTAATFTVTLGSAAPMGGLMISIMVTESGSYITDPAPTMVDIIAGATTGTLTVSTDDDVIVETAGSITALITAPNMGDGYTVGSPNTAMVTVNDNDTPVVSITAGPSPITEGAGATAIFTVSFDRTVAVDTTINVDVTESGMYIAGMAPATVVIVMGEMTGTLTVPTENDSLDETDGSVSVSILESAAGAGVGYTVGTPNTAMVTVNDDDPPAASITVADPTTITEGATVTFTLTLSSAAPVGGLTVSIMVTDNGSYISGAVPTGVGIAAGATTGTLTVPTDNDMTLEATDTITVRITSGDGYTVGTPNTAMVTVNDNDTPVASVVADSLTITEGEGAFFTVTLDLPAPAGGLMINVNVTKSRGSSLDNMVVIASGAMTSARLEVETDDNLMDEPDGSLTVTINAGTRYTVAAAPDNLVTFTVLDDDPPAARITAGSSPITEDTDATFTVTLSSAAPVGGLTISIAVTQVGSYIEGPAPTTTTVVIAAGADAGTLTVPTDDDTVAETAGSITVMITTGAGYTVDTTSTAMVTVNDNDTPAVSISLGLSPIIEGTAATFTVTLDRGAPTGGTTVRISVGSSDYLTGNIPDTVVIAARETTETLTIETDDDFTDEPNGSISVNILESAEGAGVGYTVIDPRRAAVTVNDNDLPRYASFEDATVTASEGSPVTLTVVLSTVSSLDVMVPITSSDPSRVSSATFTILAGMNTGAMQLDTAFDRDTIRNDVEVSIGMSTGDNIGTGGGENGYILDTDTNTVAIVTVVDTNGPPIISTTPLDVTENIRNAGQVDATDSDTGDSTHSYTISGGADRNLFTLVPNTGFLWFNSAPNFEMPRGMLLSDTNTNIYELMVEVSGGRGDREFTTTATIRVRVEDDNTEEPSAPATPTVTAVGVDELGVSWEEPTTNMGPAITSYTVQYRLNSAPDTAFISTGVTVDSGARTATITGLDSKTRYAVRVRAHNGESDADPNNDFSGIATQVTDNIPPTATAGPDTQTAQAGAQVGLLGTANDRDGANSGLRYSWAQAIGETPQVGLDGARTASPSRTFTVPDDATLGTITFTLSVWDVDGIPTDSSLEDRMVRVELVAGVDQTETRDGSNVRPSLSFETPAGEPEVVYIQAITQIDPEAENLPAADAAAVARRLSTLRFVRDETIYDISLTAQNEGGGDVGLNTETGLTSRTVCLPISRRVSNALNGNLRANRNITIFHFTGGTGGNWNRLESTINEDRTAICANPPSLSPFAIGYLPPDDRSDTSILLPITGGVTPPWWVTLTVVLTGAGSLLLGSSLLLRGRVPRLGYAATPGRPKRRTASYPSDTLL